MSPPAKVCHFVYFFIIKRLQSLQETPEFPSKLRNFFGDLLKFRNRRWFRIFLDQLEIPAQRLNF